MEMEIRMTITPEQDPIDRNEALRMLNQIYEPEHIGVLITEKGKMIALCMTIIKTLPSLSCIKYEEGGRV